MEKLSAAYHIPTEIWQEIFFYVLKTWLLPGSGDSILDDISLFNNGCESFSEYKRVENIRRGLRAVCRQWRAIADNIVISFAVANVADISAISDKTLRLAQRIESPSTCRCDQCPLRSSSGARIAWIQYKGIKTPASEPPLDRHVSLEHVQVISYDSLSIDTKHVNSATSLRALGMNAGNMKNNMIPSNLTHLSIRAISGREVLPEISLPHLQHLRLDLRLDLTDNTTPWKPFDNWGFPKLTYLCITGLLPEGINHEALQRFIHNHAPTLENLILDHYVFFSNSKRVWTINIYDLPRYPRLKLLGLNMRGFEALCGTIKPETIEISRLSLLILDINRLHSAMDTYTTASECLGLCTPPTVVFDKIFIAHSWNQIIQEWGNPLTTINRRWNCLPWSNPFDTQSTREFFRVFYGANVAFVDRDGVNLREGEGLKFLEKFAGLD